MSPRRRRGRRPEGRADSDPRPGCLLTRREAAGSAGAVPTAALRGQETAPHRGERAGGQGLPRPAVASASSAAEAGAEAEPRPRGPDAGRAG